ncbi:MAG: hypothetical protein ACFFD4_07000 [Candidatus Odinarchaeota archaeon]
MNELKKLVAALITGDSTKRVGATTKVLLETLGLAQEDHGQLMWLLGIASSFLNRLGLEMKYNPFHDTWFVALDLSESSEEVIAKTTGLPTALRATLYAIIMAMRDSGKTTCSVEEITKARKKKDIKTDLKQLEKREMIGISSDGTITLASGIFYHVNFEDLYLGQENSQSDKLQS